MNGKAHIIYIVAIAVLAVLSFRSCEPDPAPTVRDFRQVDSLKAVVADLKLRKDSVQIRIDTVEKVRVKYLTKYRGVRYDSLIPCPEKLNLCDSVLAADSTAISELKTVIGVADKIITDQDSIIKLDSLEKQRLRFVNDSLAKANKKRNWRSWWKGFKTGFVTGNVTGGGAVYRFAR